MTNANAEKKQQYLLYCDGSCIDNPGPGGWAYTLRTTTSDKILFERTDSGGTIHTTNSEMELTAIIAGLTAITLMSKSQSQMNPNKIKIYSDSQYVIDGINKYLPVWKKQGWRKTNNKPVAHADLWQILNTLLEKHTIEAIWIKGHSNHPENDYVDEMARTEANKYAAIKKYRKQNQHLLVPLSAFC